MVVSLVVMLVMVAVVYLFDVPNPNMILITGLAVFTSLYGFPSGIACALVMILYSMYFFSEDHSFIRYSAINLQKMGVIVLGVVLTTLFIGNLKRQQNEATEKLREMNRLLEQDNQTLEAASLTDGLTGARNRFALRRDFDGFESRYLHVMMLDLDDFKGINDTCGHETGDFVLKKVAALLMEAFGRDSCYRYGGDEFLVICQGVEEADFLSRMDRLRQDLIHLHQECGHGRPIHFSAGYIHGDCEMAGDLRMMLRQADAMLYRAKGMGKDRYLGGDFRREDIILEEEEQSQGPNRRNLAAI